MPELAEVEVVRRNLERWWRGHGASRVQVHDEALLKEGDASAFEEALGKPLERARRRGKYLICDLQGGQSVVFHFRMTGKIVCAGQPEPRFARLAWLVDAAGWLVFKDQRRLGEAWLVPTGQAESVGAMDGMGPEPTSVTVEHLRRACSSRRMLKSALLDQSVVAGVGNIAVSELFWRLGLGPRVRCGELTDKDWVGLAQEMPDYFEEIIEKSMADEIFYVNSGGESNIFQVYGREGEFCSVCGGEIARAKVASRSSYYCPNCQGD